MKKLVLVLVSALSFTVHAEEKSNDNFKKTDEVLSEVVKKALVLAEKTGEFAIEQAPLLLKEFYLWHIWSSVLGIVFAIILIFIGYKVPRMWLKKEAGRFDDVEFFGMHGDFDGVLAYIMFGACGLFGGILIATKTYDLVYILVAPKLYLIDYFIR